MKIQGICAIIILCTLTLIGCASSQRAQCEIEKRYITITTEPEGATVMQINPTGQPITNLGMTPIIEQPVIVVTDIVEMKNLPESESLDMMRRSNGGVSVVIRKDGYQQYNGVLKTDKDKTMMHKITLKSNEQ